MLSANLGHGEREPVGTKPPAAGTAEAREEPTTNAETARAQQRRNTDGILDWFVHCHDPDQAHGFDLLVREFLSNEAGHFGVWLSKLPSGCVSADITGDPIVVLEKKSLEDDDFGRHSLGRLEVFRTEYALGVVFSNTETFALQAGDPFLAGRAVGSDREGDDAILFAPTPSWF